MHLKPSVSAVVEQCAAFGALPLVPATRHWAFAEWIPRAVIVLDAANPLHERVEVEVLVDGSQPFAEVLSRVPFTRMRSTSQSGIGVGSMSANTV